MRNRAVHIAVLFAWVVLFHPLAHAFDSHDAHPTGITVGQACEFCHSQAGTQAPVRIALPVLDDFEVVPEPLMALAGEHELPARGRAPPSNCRA